MIKIKRLDEPNILRQGENPKSKGEVETLDAIVFYSDPNNHQSTYKKTGTTTVGYKVYSDDSIRKILLNMFHGKCAYCESKITNIYNGDVEHFRPKGGIREAVHSKPGYYWLAAEWDNLLFACPFCNQTNTHVITDGGILKEIVLGKHDQFPLLTENCRLNHFHGGIYFTDRSNYQLAFDLEESERLLINPCKDIDIENLFKYEDNGVIVVNDGLSNFQKRMAGSSIVVYALNRLGLTQARREKIIHIKTQIKRVEIAIVNYLKYANKSDEERIWFEGIMRDEMNILKGFKDPEQEYAGLARYIINKYFDEAKLI